jgi:hypothetical protein
MPQSAGTTGELYTEDAGGNQVPLGAPPAAPSDIPPPTQPVRVTEPVVTKRRMADEAPDGSIRDTSAEAISQPGKDLGFRNLTDESENAPKPKPTEAAPPTETPAPPVEAKPAEPAPPKVYAGKFKTAEELEKSYQELQREFTRKSQENAELAKRAEAKPPVEVPKTPAQIAAEEARKNEILSKFVADPEAYLSERDQVASQRTQIALAVQHSTNEWRKNNPDLAEHEYFVAAEATRLMNTDPELAKNPAELLNKATDNFRQITGKLRNEGAKEALTQETRVIPLLNNAAPSAPSEQPSSKAPLTSDDAYALHMRMLKEQEQKSHRGLRR